MSGCDCSFEAKNREERRILKILLLINGAMFVIELVAGLLAQSTGLLADSLDMFADAAVYAISLSAVGAVMSRKVLAARVSGVLQVTLGLGVIIEVARRFWFGSDPEGVLMIAIGALALAANVTCLALLARHRDGEVHMRASWIFSANDVLANLGVLAAAGLVMVSGSRLPDLIIGALIATLVMRGGIIILREARESEREEAGSGEAASCDRD
ncbi:cation transporter [Alcanivorax sp. S6407]|uniref:cation transporter n=1 Tax=Alcanivorax sp. S6407 TaxID=2926424 RepID=UPI001FF168A1|nr:cation transporter [Alcanivorax sp. S6407]MCK0154342.1 cation transporter [Alcanivorax sp. S6407]